MDDHMLLCLSSLCAAFLGCNGGSGTDDSSGDGTTTSAPATSEQTTLSSPDSSATPQPDTSSTTGVSATGVDTSSGADSDTTGGDGTANASTDSDSTGGDSTDSTGGETACVKTVVLMGYWPPTNEMLRQWSTNPAQNPDGWMGENWGGHGYDVHAFFPEFPPDGNPSNDPIGSPGAVGSEESDLQVDYQDTSTDFWALVDMHQPTILITTSRGGGIGWEIEAIEGGHGVGNPGDASQDWISDGYGAVTLPTEATIEPRSWDAISEYRQGNTLPTQLPVDAIFSATDALGLTNVVVDNATSGSFLSGFLALHGLAYNQSASHNVAAGHIHVGNGLPTADAEQLIETTLSTVIAEFPADDQPCPR
ncbi:MAG: hypothetical protein JKY37_24600 [Nannocystaceae bacterium]|nr:hypothetical protein [Nannocystaceae bacterium]